jgi:hypothetical protein
MNETALLASTTELLGKEADLLFALINFYGLVIIAVIGWIVNTGKDGPGVSWFRVLLFNLGFLGFFVASFGGFWFLYERLEETAQVWRQLAMQAGGASLPAGSIDRLAWLPPKQWLWSIWGFNGMILILASVLLRRGGFGRET